MQTNYDVNYFIKKFEAIPENKWITGDYGSIMGDEHCALGHCGVHLGTSVSDIPEAKALSGLIPANNIVDVNDGYVFYYQQPTPRQRILAALYDVKYKQLQEAAVEEAQEITNNPKEETVYANI